MDNNGIIEVSISDLLARVWDSINFKTPRRVSIPDSLVNEST